VKSFAFLAAFLTTVFCGSADAQSWQELSTNLFTNTAIIWQVPANQLPKNFWIYRRVLPHIFPATVTSNAVVLASLQKRGFPRPSTNDFFISEDKGPDYPGTIPIIFEVKPGDANLHFSIPNYSPVSEKEIPDDETIIKLARKYAPRLGLDPAKLTQGKIYTHSCDTDQAVNNVCGHGVFFCRQLDGIDFFSGADDGTSAEGYSMEFGEHGKILAFSVRWSEVEHYKNENTASQDEIIRCLRGHKVIVMPNFQPDDFIRLRNLATAKKFTITRITPYYGEGMFGEVPTNDVPSQFATPFVELEAVADFGSSNAPVKLLSPILSSEVQKLLGENTK
jgi:hypothetical protein